MTLRASARAMMALVIALGAIPACSEAGSPDGGLDARVTDAPRDAGPPLTPYPSVEMLPERPELPDLFESFDGTRRATSVADWEGWRRAELRELLSFYLYGYTPERSLSVSGTLLVGIDDWQPGVRYEELELVVNELPLTIHVSLFLPMGVASPPVFVAPNRCGNQEVSADPRIRGTTAWIGANCGADVESSRGVRASNWPITAITDAGFAFAAFHESEIDPDDGETDFGNGVHPLLLDAARDPRLRWGRIAAWAWGVSRVVDYLSTSSSVDGRRIAVVGHSRRGKTALLASALDERIAMVIAHQSGRGGAALTRNLSGEPVAAINTVFPSWFDDVFPTFADRETRIPVDQHMLIALSAPRLVLCTDGDADAWADPMGARMAVDAAEPAWALYGVPGIVRDPEGLPTIDGSLSWRSRPGDHELTAADWGIFLAFATAHWGA